ncbi:MAG TPA: hypothetical protein VKB88_34400 [Bryobacteraceae bacterium]|nr:hypothetical protein [Bryobacteraceae bacterium]
MPYLEPQFHIGQCQFSPDGHWPAYTSDEAAQGNEVYAQAYPSDTDKTLVSNEGGSQPRWRRDGKELFYMGPGGRVMALDVKTAPKFQALIPRQLFETQMYLPEAGTRANDTTNLMFRYDVTRDGKRFLVNNMVQAAPAVVSPPITWVLNWTGVEQMSMNAGARLGLRDPRCPWRRRNGRSLPRARSARGPSKSPPSASPIRFEFEARAIAALNHPNICQLYDVGPNYLVMELVEGEPPQGAPPPEQATSSREVLPDAAIVVVKRHYRRSGSRWQLGIARIIASAA